MPLYDAYARRLRYLRLSVTDKCNFRCIYCLPQGYQKMHHTPELSLTEIRVLLHAFVAQGTEKVRLTGGEPTLRKDIAQIIACCKEEGIQQVALTTNGDRLSQKFPSLRSAGLDKLNVSLDSFDEETFFKITGKRGSAQILTSIRDILDSGFKHIKINTLLMRNCADDAFQAALAYVKELPVTLRFIELMQTGGNQTLFQQQHIEAQALENTLLKNGWQLRPRSLDAGPAREYRHANFAGSIGFIAPYSRNFCQSCNRLRITAQGQMHLCLFASRAYPIRSFLTQNNSTDLQAYLQEIIAQKPEQHYLLDKKFGLIQDLSMIGG